MVNVRSDSHSKWQHAGLLLSGYKCREVEFINSPVHIGIGFFGTGARELRNFGNFPHPQPQPIIII